LLIKSNRQHNMENNNGEHETKGETTQEKNRRAEDKIYGSLY